MSDARELAETLRARLRAHGDRAAVRRGLGSASDGSGAPSATEEISHRRLLGLATDIGVRLDELAGPRHTVVAIVGRPGLALYVATLGALLSGHVPALVDAAQPRARVGHALDLVRPAVRIRCGTAPTGQVSGAAPLLAVDDNGHAAVEEDGPAPDAARPFPGTVGYLGFTSGSRGAPRAVIGSAAGLLHFVTWQCEAFKIGPGDRFGQLTSPGFDVFYRDLLTPLAGGASLCVPGAEQLAGARVLDWLAAARVTRLHTVPGVARYWLRASWRTGLPDLDTTFFAGEALSDTLVRDWRSATGGRQIVNLYGTAEATLAQTWFDVPADCATGTQPVGTPVPGVRLRVLTPEGAPCPPGTAGEIVVESPYLSHGYLPEPAEPAEPTGPTATTRLTQHRTGDRGYYARDGLLHIVGRLDREVKIRGVRVNLDEVGAALTSHPAVGTAVVVTRTDRAGDLRLEAHVTARTRIPPTPQKLRRHLAETLPDPMVPAAYHVRTDHPLSPTGKAAPSAFLPDTAAPGRARAPYGQQEGDGSA